MIVVGYMFAPQKACHKKCHLKKSPDPNKQPLEMHSENTDLSQA